MGEKRKQGKMGERRIEKKKRKRRRRREEEDR